MDRQSLYVEDQSATHTWPSIYVMTIEYFMAEKWRQRSANKAKISIKKH